MARLNINPTRMELTKLREKLGIAKRSHKLLKDKQEILIRNFIAISEQAKTLRKEVEVGLKKANNGFVLSSSVNYEDMLLMNLSYGQKEVSTHVTSKNMLNVSVPHFEINDERVDKSPGEILYPYSFLSTSSDIDDSSNYLNELLPKIIYLAEYEKSCQMLALEIEATRRRVNALEFRTIVDIEETIKFILMKIDENERNNLARLSKLSD